MAFGGETDHVDSVTHDYIHANAQQMVFDAPVGLSLFLDRAQVKHHGGSDSYYPYVASAINANYYTKMVAGTITTKVEPVSTDLVDAAHQDGWGLWYEDESISFEEMAKNGGDWAKGETVIPLAKLKADALMDNIGYMFDQNLRAGDAANNTIIGLVKLFDITNTDYNGWDFNVTNSTLRPANTTIATSYTSLAMADLFEAYGDIEDKGRYADCILLHPDVLKKLRTLSEVSVRRSQGGDAKIGHFNFDVLNADVIPWRAMPTTTSTVIYFMNFGQHAPIGAKGDSGSRKVSEGKNFVLEFAGPKPLGYWQSGWEERAVEGYPGVRSLCAYGGFKMMCTKPMDQAYISIA